MIDCFKHSAWALQTMESHLDPRFLISPKYPTWNPPWEKAKFCTSLNPVITERYSKITEILYINTMLYL